MTLQELGLELAMIKNNVQHYTVQKSYSELCENATSSNGKNK